MSDQAVIVTFNGDNLNYSMVNCGLRELILAADKIQRVAERGVLVKERYPIEDLGTTYGMEGPDRAIVYSDGRVYFYGDAMEIDAIVGAAVLRARYEYDLRKSFIESEAMAAQRQAMREAIVHG